MKHSNQQVANLVINYASFLGIELLSYTNNEDAPFTEQYLTDCLNNLGMDLDADEDQDLWIYIEEDSKIALLFDGETWHNNQPKGPDLVFTLQFLGGDIHLALN